MRINTVNGLTYIKGFQLKRFKRIALSLLFLLLFSGLAASKLAMASTPAVGKQTINALYIPLADHYAALVAFERYRDKMKHADFTLTKMKNWDLLRAYYQSGEVEMAFVMSPLAMSMYTEKPHFRWIGLMHRDGNALAINDLIYEKLRLPPMREDRKPDDQVAKVLDSIHNQSGKSTVIGMPHLLSTHTVVLYRYLKENGLTLSLRPGANTQVLAVPVPPSKSLAFIKAKSNRAQPAAFEQSLPWADVVETGSFGHVAWYSKDVMPWKYGHVECIALATDESIRHKRAAVEEVMYFIHKAGADIETARQEGGEALDAIVKIVRKHIPAHNRKAITASLDPNLRVINYQNLNVDKAGLKQIMDLAVEGGILKTGVDIDEFADTQFQVDLK
ncbi:MAG: ABC transporter substrate-binding protein [Gammaproteobacteria bacterium]|nr:ABC transporter substrate-binding protein [Gammaproteobacteria bacterium]